MTIRSLTGCVKYQLMRMRDKLESQFKQMGYSSTSGIGGKV